MTAVNEHLNRQMVSNSQQIMSSGDSELFCLSNAIIPTDCNNNRQHNSPINQNNQPHQFHHSNQTTQNSHLNNLSNSSNLPNSTTSNLTSLSNVPPTNSLHRLNTINGNSKKCDLNNNTMGELGSGETNRTLTRLIGSINDTQICLNSMTNGMTNTMNAMNNANMNNLMNHDAHLNAVHQSDSHQTSDNYANRNIINNKNSSLITNLEDNCHQSYVHQTSHNFHPLNHLDHLNHHLDRSLNSNSVNKLNVSGRRGRPPKKDSKSRSRQSKGEFF